MLCLIRYQIALDVVSHNTCSVSQLYHVTIIIQLHVHCLVNRLKQVMWYIQVVNVNFQ